MASSRKMPVKRDRPMLWMGKYLGLALTLPASVMGGYFIGAFIDDRWHTGFWRVVCLILGFAGGLVQILKELGRESKR